MAPRFTDAPTPTIQAELIEDLRAAVLVRLQADGFAVPQALQANASRVMECYFTLLRRRLAERPRRVHIARRLYVPAAADKAFAAIVRRVEQGAELAPFFSKSVIRPETVDGLLYDWDIHHLHLSERGTGKFAPRSDYVLMARFTRHDAYLICVRQHPEGEEWSRTDLLNRLHEAWPESLTSYRPPGVLPSGEPTTDEMVVIMRRANFLYMFETTDGVCYLPPGGGVMKSGLSADVRTAADRIMNQIQQWQEMHQAQPGRLRRLAKKHGRTMGDVARLALELDGDEIYVRWVEGVIRFRVGTLPTEWHSV